MPRRSGRSHAARFGFGADRRIGASADFEQLLREGRRETFKGFTIIHRRRACGPARLGILVSRQHSPLATERNYLKRCVREAFRLEQQQLGPIDVLVRPARGVKPGAQMIAALRRAFGRLGR